MQISPSVVSIARRSALGLAVVLASAAPAAASTLPGAGDTGVRFGAGIGAGGLGVSLDAPASPELRIGASVGAGLPLASLASFDVRGAYKLPSVGVPKLDLAVIVGVLGGASFTGAPFALGLEAGAGASYEFVPKLEGRVNLVYGVPMVGGFTWYSAPTAGLEFGYRFTPELEGTIGWTGRGENIGIRITR